MGLDNGFVPNRCQAIIWINADLINSRIYAALDREELTGYETNILVMRLDIYVQGQE